MKQIVLLVSAAATLAGCSVNSSGPVTAWGKDGVTMLNYRTDGAECAVLAATTQSDENGAKTAGVIRGPNATVPSQSPSGTSTADMGAGPVTSGSNAPSLGGGTYQGTGNADFATRAAQQQSAQEMAAQRMRTDRLKSCLVSRGYTEFNLTSEQRAKLATLEVGSEARREYLYKLGTNPAVLEKQAVVRKETPAPASASATN